MTGVIRFVEGKLKLKVNQTKSRCAPLKECSFLGFQIGARGRAVWTAKAQARFKQRVREITSRSRGHRVQTVIAELRRYVVGWLNYFGLSQTYKVLLELEEWVRRRVRLYYWTARREAAVHQAKPDCGARRRRATNGSSRERDDDDCWRWAFIPIG